MAARRNGWQLARERAAKRQQRERLRLQLTTLGAAGNIEGIKRLMDWVEQAGAPGEREYLQELLAS